MGSVRTLLAIAVVFGHSYGFIFVGGRLAVQLFYVISGFLISYVLVEARTYRSVSSFYINRSLGFLYWFVALTTIIAVLLASLILIKRIKSSQPLRFLALKDGLA